jgi:hypothetical protein
VLPAVPWIISENSELRAVQWNSPSFAFDDPFSGIAEYSPAELSIDMKMLTKTNNRLMTLTLAMRHIAEFSFRGSSFELMYSRPSGPIAVTWVM